MRRQQYMHMNNDTREQKIYSYNLTFHRVRKQKCNKADHICIHCKRIIKKGDPSNYHSGKAEAFYHYHSCIECEKGDEIE